MDRTELERAVERQIEQLGFELVELDLAGSRNRPLLRLRIDWPPSATERGVTIEDCARVSRALERFLENEPDHVVQYQLEVSSPGLERPLHKRRDFERFAGREIAVKTQVPIGSHGKRIEGLLRGVRDAEQGEQILIELPDTELVSVAREDIVRAHLIFRWDD